MTGIVTLNHSIDWYGHVYWEGDSIILPVTWFTVMINLGYIVAAT
jgi:hypothetical protein